METSIFGHYHSPHSSSHGEREWGPSIICFPPFMCSVPKRNTTKSFENDAKILRRMQRVGKNLKGAGAGAFQET